MTNVKKKREKKQKKYKLQIFQVSMQNVQPSYDTRVTPLGVN